MSGTIRQEMLERLRRAPATLRELARELDLRDGEAADHLTHVRKSLRRTERLREDPARCEACGFAFRKRERVGTPGRCPRCRSERIRPAVFSIEEPGASRGGAANRDGGP